jgi:outer membrane protein W
MRRFLVVGSVVLFLSATAAFAQNVGAVRLSAFIVNPSDTPEPDFYPGSDRAYGGAIEYFSKRNLSWQLAVSSEPTSTTTFTSSGLPFAKFVRMNPIDGTVRFHFGDSSLKPFLGAGARYIHVAGRNNWRPELAGGLSFAITPHLGIDLEARELFNRRKPDVQPTGIRVHDGDFNEGSSRRLSAGLGWRF